MRRNNMLMNRVRIQRTTRSSQLKEIVVCETLRSKIAGRETFMIIVFQKVPSLAVTSKCVGRRRLQEQKIF
ncbi:unnamed protein product [Amoebophrya sp. A25]|nr:unnamed protein product [Amoebophrya sp. A25]|eukprot:GSA25T00017841001.1